MKYHTIVIDPPWEFDKTNGFQRMKHTGVAKVEHYKTMTNEELKQFQINEFAYNDCDLFLWVVTRKIEFSFELLKSWGFRFVDFITWDKVLGVPVNGFHRKAEWCMYAVKGKKGISKKGKFIPTVITEKRGKHSEKPKLFYDIIKTNTLEPRIDIFARKRHEGFDAWGDQVTERRNGNE